MQHSLNKWVSSGCREVWRRAPSVSLSHWEASLAAKALNMLHLQQLQLRFMTSVCTWSLEVKCLLFSKTNISNVFFFLVQTSPFHQSAPFTIALLVLLCVQWCSDLPCYLVHEHLGAGVALQVCCAWALSYLGSCLLVIIWGGKGRFHLGCTATPTGMFKQITSLPDITLFLGTGNKLWVKKPLILTKLATYPTQPIFTSCSTYANIV